MQNLKNKKQIEKVGGEKGSNNLLQFTKLQTPNSHHSTLTAHHLGITLIALVVTIVILLILAGITIATLTGENGLLNRAQDAVEKTNYAKAEEKVKLAVLASYDKTAKLDKDLLKQNLNNTEGINPKVEEVTWDLEVTVDGYIFEIKEVGKVTYIGKTKLPENTVQNPQPMGEEVALKEGWGTQAVKYIKTADGKENTEITTVATVYAISVGGGETVPVPKDFYYVGGNLNTGVIISDNEADKYDGKTDKTAHSYNTSLKGNQFVWIPCTEDEYVKTPWGKQNANWETTVEAGELAQIQKYGGFYVARYEAGLATTIDEFTSTQTHSGSNQIYNLDGVPQSRAGQIPWMFVDWTHSKENAESMYNNNYVYSGLITGTQWDVMLNKIVEKTELETADLTSSSAWGNYRNTQIAYIGRVAKATYSSSTWKLAPFGEETSGTTANYASDNTGGDLLTTGASNVTEKYHIYDVAGNLWEWTEEASTYATSGQYRVIRGGSYFHSYAAYPACYRYGSYSVGSTGLHLGFRPVLYIK